MNMLWVKSIGGRLKLDYRYTSLCYNTFPFPEISESKKKEIRDAAEEMLKRYKEHYPEGSVIKCPSPNLVLNPEKTNFYDFTIEDFKMENYEPIKPQLKLELGI
mgnify:CR=1 FL=1